MSARAHPYASFRPRIAEQRGASQTLATVLLFAFLAFAANVAFVYLADPAFATRSGADLAGGLSLNAIPGALLATLLLALTRRALASLWLSLLVVFLVYLASSLKQRELGVALLPADFLLLRHIGSASDLLLHYVSHRRRDIAIAIVLCMASGWVFWKSRPLLGLNRGRQGVLLIAVGAAAFALAARAQPWASIYGDDDGFLAWTPDTSADRVGLVASLVRYGWETVSALPVPDRAAARRFVDAQSALPAAADSSDLPDIVVLQSESFFDPSRLHGVDASAQLSHLHALQAVSAHGDLWVPTFGGGTIRTEFEVLTGVGVRCYPQVMYPYFRLTPPPVASLASVLDAHGYRSIVVHPHDRHFWNRASAMRAMGFDAFDAEEQFEDAPRQGWYVSDDALVDHILKRLPDNGPPTFLFAISMENHGPYVDFPNVDTVRRDSAAVPAGLEGDAARMLRGYLYHLGNADRALGRLVDALGKRQRRTLLLFYGDHLPALPALYERVPFADGMRPSQQPVPWLLVDSARPGGARIDTASFYLPSILLHAAGIGDAYFSRLDRAREREHFGPEWTPDDSAGMCALMQLRTSGEADSVLGSLEHAAN